MNPAASRLLRLAALLAPVVYLAVPLETLVHEVVGHGLAALALGGRFTGFRVGWDGGGEATAGVAPGSPAWQHILQHGAGILATTIVGLVLCLYASRRKADSASGVVTSILGVYQITGGLYYALSKGVEAEGNWDPVVVLEWITKSTPEHVELVKTLWCIAAGVLFLVTQWWGMRLVWRHLETAIGGGAPLSLGRRAIGLLCFLAIPALIRDYATAQWTQFESWGHLSAASIVLFAAALVRFARPPFPAAFSVKNWHLVTSWAALVAMVVCIHVWLNFGVTWTPSARARALGRAAHDAATAEDLSLIAADVADYVSARAKDPVGGARDTGDLLLALGRAWERLEQDDRALACYERLGREWPTYRKEAIAMQVQLLNAQGNLRESEARVEQFIADPRGEDTSDACYLLANVLEARGKWADALSVWEQWVPSAQDLHMARTEQALGIARCRFELGDSAHALATIEMEAASTTDFQAPEVAMAYAEYAARSGRLDDARTLMAALSPARREVWNRSIDLVSAWLSKDADALLQIAAAGSLVPAMCRAGVRLLFELGPTAKQLLLDRIANGDRAMIRLAAFSGHLELIEPLQKRRAMNGPDADSVSGAIFTLKTLARLRPASRPSR